MGNASSQAEFAVPAAGRSVNGVVDMTLDGTGTPQAVSVTNPVPIYDAYAQPVVTTWGTGTSLNTAITMNTQGMDSVAVTIQPSGTITGGAVTFEVYDGANWVAIKCARETSYATDSTYSANGATIIQGWTIPAAAFPQCRVRLSSVITGSSTPQLLVTAIVSSAPDVSIVTAGLDPQQSGHPGIVTLQAEQVVAVGAASAASAAVQATTNRVILSATTACWVQFGASPIAVVNAAGNIYVPANFPMPPIAVTPGVTKIACIQASAGGYLSIIETL